jgi:hypothetical protein
VLKAGREMIVYRCDNCSEIRDCDQRLIEDTEYDICVECWTALMSKLEGKGRKRKVRETVLLPVLPGPAEPSPELPFRQPPTIVADADRV